MILAPPSGRRPGADAPPCPPLATPLSMTHGYATQAKCFHVKYTHRYILYTHTTMRYRCEILNHGIDGYEVWLHGRNQGRSGVNLILLKIDIHVHFMVMYMSKRIVFFKITIGSCKLMQLAILCK